MHYMEDPIIFDGMIRAGSHVFLVDWYPDGVPRGRQSRVFHQKNQKYEARQQRTLVRM